MNERDAWRLARPGELPVFISTRGTSLHGSKRVLWGYAVESKRAPRVDQRQSCQERGKRLPYGAGYPLAQRQERGELPKMAWCEHCFFTRVDH